MAEFLQAVRSAPKVADSRATLADLLLDGFAAVGERRYAAGAPLLRRAIAPLAAGQPIPDDALPHLMAVGQAAGLLYDDLARYQMEKRWVAELRDRGAIAALLTALGIQLSVQVQEGRFADAEATLAEGRALSEATGYRAILGAYAWQELWALARQGREADTRQLAARMLREFAGRGKVRGLESARCAGHARARPGRLRRRGCATRWRLSRGRTYWASLRSRMWSRPEPGAGSARPRLLPWRPSRPGRWRAGPTWPWVCWPAAGHCLPMTTMPRRSTGLASTTCSAAGSSRSWPGRTRCTGSGCAASAAAATPATSSAMPSRCLTRWA